MDTMASNVYNSPTVVQGASICSACEDFAICVLRRRNKKPILFCEEFKPADHMGKPMGFRPSLWNSREPAQDSRTRLRSGAAFKGLCRTCRKLPTCDFTKPGGGTWDCPAYEKDESSGC